jgi:hypothetical protein
MYGKKEKKRKVGKGGTPKPKASRSKRVAGRATPSGRGGTQRKTRRTGGGYAGG